MSINSQNKQPIPLIAKIAVKLGFITKDQLKRAILLQDTEKEDGHDSSLPEIFAKAGMITPEKMLQIHSLAAQYTAKKPFDSQPEPHDAMESEDDSHKKPLKKEDFRIRISDDNLYASLESLTADPSSIQVDKIFAKANDLGITFGLVKASSLKNSLINPDHKNPIIIAQGAPPNPGKDPHVSYQFDIDHHRQKNYDFNASSKITLSAVPTVKEGALLAKKTAMVPPDSGVDIFGQSITPEIIDDVIIQSGKGAEVFEDKLKVFATTSGVPFLSVENVVSVLPQVSLDKDYGVSSGPVERDSCISTTGTLTGEYPVRGGNIAANEIRNAQIDVIGSVRALMGMTNTVIKAQGDIRAKYIRGCRIETYGSVFVENEIMDSTILASGVCVCENSKIIASTIAATQGIKAQGIGTETSIPCDLVVGRETHILKVLERINEKIQRNHDWILKLGETSNNLMTETEKVQQQISPLMTFHKKAEQAIQVTQAHVDALNKNRTEQPTLDEEKKLNELKAKDKSVLVSIRTCSERLKEIQQEASGIPEEIRSREKENAQLLLDRSAIIAWSKTIPASARLEVRGGLCTGTEISGTQAHLVIEKHVEGILAQEIKKDTEQGQEWAISLSKHP